MADSLTAPPASYSIGQPDYDPEVGRNLCVRVDGADQSNVVEYDCVAGTVVRNKLDEHGRPQLNARRDHVLRETVRGKVTVSWREGRVKSL
jgi:hypothetical protein